MPTNNNNVRQERLLLGEEADWVEAFRAPTGLPAVAIGVFVLGLIGGVAGLVYATGGTALVWPHLMYLPLILAAAAFRVRGGIAAAVIAGLILGPYMPMDVEHGIRQTLQNWTFRLGFFLLVGGACGLLSKFLNERIDELKEAKRQMQYVLNNTKDVIFQMDFDGNYIYCNPAAERLTGHPVEQLLQMNIRYLVAPEHLAMLRDRLRRRLEDEVDEKPFEVQIHHKDGNLVWTELTMGKVCDPLNQILAVQGVARDITERKKAEEAIRKSEQQFRVIMDNLADLVAVLDPNGRRLYNSPSYEGILGATDKLRGSSSFDQVHPEDRMRVREAFQETVRTGVGQRLEYRMVGLDGQARHIESQGSVVRDAQGRVSQVVVVSRDVTERKEAERALRESEQKYRELVMLANSIILHWSRDGRIIFLNEFGQRFFGYTEAEICGRHVVGTIVPASESSGRNLSSLMDEICANPMGFEQNENENMRRNGEHVWVAWTNRVVLDERGQVAEVLSIGLDITARKRVEEELRATQASLEQRILARTAELAVARDRAEEADRLKSAFLAAMSHELRTPLNSIIGFTGIMVQGLAGPLNPEQSKQLGMVRSSARHLLDLINDVLDLSKIEAGQLEVRAEPFDLPAAIERVTASLKPLAEKKGLALTAEVSPALSEMVSDRRRVEQILLNLLNNAIKFTEHGRVALTAERAADYRRPPDAAPLPAVRLCVTDTGIGIKPADLALLFQPFRQIDTGLAREHEGTGLGLAICRRLAALMGGEISAASQWLYGSEFTVILPLSKPPEL